VPDEPAETRLVILGPEHPHAAKQPDSPARQTAATWLDSRGTSPRLNKNMLVFLAPDRTRLAELEDAVRQYLAWKSICDEREQLDLSPFQAGQAANKLQSADETVQRRIPETYHWLLVPTQEAQGSLDWEELRLQGEGALAERASRRLKNDGLLYVEYGPTLLRHELDIVPLWRGDHVSMNQLWEDYARYLYLPRLRDSGVLLASIQQGVARLTWESDTFAYAESYDDARGRYPGLRGGEGGSVTLDGHSVLAKPEAARRQLDADEAARQARETVPTGSGGTPGPGGIHDGPGPYTPGAGGGSTTVVDPPARVARLHRFHGTVPLQPRTASSDAGKVADHVIAHLAGQYGANVRVTLEIEADLPEGASDDLVRTVTENCRTLKFADAGFEEASFAQQLPPSRIASPDPLFRDNPHRQERVRNFNVHAELLQPRSRVAVLPEVTRERSMVANDQGLVLPGLGPSKDFFDAWCALHAVRAFGDHQVGGYVQLLVGRDLAQQEGVALPGGGDADEQRSE
jgi:hypothetical protein